MPTDGEPKRRARCGRSLPTGKGAFDLRGGGERAVARNAEEVAARLGASPRALMNTGGKIIQRQLVCLLYGLCRRNGDRHANDQ